MSMVEGRGSLSTWRVDIAGMGDAVVDRAHAHAVVSRWLDRRPAETAAKLKDGHWLNWKDWSFRGVLRRGVVNSLLIGTVTTSAEKALLTSVRAGMKVRLGREHGTIAGTAVTVSRTTWAELLGETPHSAWVIRCDTPVSIRSRNRFTPLLEPRSVVNSLLNHVNAVEPTLTQALSLDDRELKSLWVSDIDGRNVVLPVAKLKASGFVGRMRFVCDDPIAARKFGVLLRFGEFAGLGSYATRGLGVIALEPTWPGGAFRSA